MCRTCQPEAVSVTVRVEGQNYTIFEGPVTTTLHRVSTRTGGTRHCNGLNGDTNRCPGATCTGALDDASKASAFSFDGTYDNGFDDFFITRIGSETPGANRFWAICLNKRFLSVGGCQQIVEQGDEVLFAFAVSGPNAADRTVNFLRLYGPASAPVGNVTLTVTDGKGAPIQDAQISGRKFPELDPLPKTDVNGKVTIRFAAATYGLKADKKDKLVSIRSNQHVLAVA